MNARFCFSRLRRSPIARFATVSLVVLSWSSLVSCSTNHHTAVGGIYDAAKSGDLEKVRVLLKENPDLALCNDAQGDTLLHWAALKGHKDVVELLLTSKAEINAKDKDGWTPLHFAADKGYKDTVELLLANKAEVNVKNNVGDTPLLLAALLGSKDVVELLLANKAEVNAKDNKGETPMHYAGRMGHEDVVELLRQHGGHE